MQAGRLRHIIEIQQVVAAPNTTGEPAREWTTYARRRAEIEALNGRESFIGGQTQGSTTHRVVIRGRDLSIKPKHRVLFGSRVFDVNSVITDATKQMTVMLCVEAV